MGIFDKIKNIFSTKTESKEKKSNLKSSESHELKHGKNSELGNVKKEYPIR